MKLTIGDKTYRILERAPQPITKVAGGGTDEQKYPRLGWARYDPAKRRENIRKWIDKYRRGGPYADAIDSYWLFTLANGYKFVCEDGAEQLRDQVQAWADKVEVDLDSIMAQGILSTILAGDGYQEIVSTAGDGIWGVLTRDPSMFEKVYDEYGRVTGYKQFTKIGAEAMGDKGTEINPEILINLVLFRIPGDIYGLSIWERADDDIQRDCDIIESVAKAVHRHGTPKQQWNVGTPENPASNAEMKAIENEIDKMDAKTDFVTSNTEITMLDTTGISNVDTYSNVSLQRTACSLGVPEEMLGLGRGSTEATATVRMDTFLKKIGTIQSIVARTYTRALIDRITDNPGKVWIEFNAPPKDMLKIAQTIQALAGANMTDPFSIFTRDEMRAEMGKEPMEEKEIDDEIEEV